MNRFVLLAFSFLNIFVCVVAGREERAVSLENGFARVPVQARPWCYWWWINGHVDKKTITADLESMKRLGFGGLLMFDSRGYWDDERHVVMPKAEVEFMSPLWQDNVCFAIREAARLGLEFTMNVSSSGGKLDGPWLVGADAPKQLLCCAEPLPSGVSFRKHLLAPDRAHYQNVAVFAVRTEGGTLTARDWFVAGDGTYTMSATSGKRLDGGKDEEIRPAREVVELTNRISGEGVLEWDVPPDGVWSLVRFGYATIPGHDRDVDVLDPQAVAAHFKRISGPLYEKVGGHFGKTLTHFYSVSWEGAVPTWTKTFESAFKRIVGYEIRPLLPMLAGFEIGEPGAHARFMRDFRWARNEMFRLHFYGTMRALARKMGVKWYSESGGPWVRSPAVFREADQLSFLAMNDLPQGEFWYRGVDANGGRYHTRGAVSTAHAYGLPRASAEAFTHMTWHWSAYPAVLKRPGDEAFADGINHFVWHTFTCSPEKFGVPGYEYFAGTHINRNVTWHRMAAPFITYLGRCQWMLQQGTPVVDYAVWAGDRVYQHWGRYREKPYDASKLRIPAGYAYDVINTDVLLHRAVVKEGRLVLAGGQTYAALILDPEFQDSRTPAVRAKVAELRAAGLETVDAPCLPSRPTLPDFESSAHGFTTAHRRTETADLYFVTGAGRSVLTFRVAGRPVEQWDAVTGTRRAVASRVTSDGRTELAVEFPENGSGFFVFQERPAAPLDPMPIRRSPLAHTGDWRIDFRNAGSTIRQPEPIQTKTLFDFAQSKTDDVRCFAGTAHYTTDWELTDEQARTYETLSLGNVVGGLAEVLVNGKRCGLTWTSPWEVSVKGALKTGTNRIEIRFTNTWANRLIGDCALPSAERVTRSGLRYHQGPRVGKHHWAYLPTIYSGYATTDPLFASGILGPITFR